MLKGGGGSLQGHTNWRSARRNYDASNAGTPRPVAGQGASESAVKLLSYEGSAKSLPQNCASAVRTQHRPEFESSMGTPHHGGNCTRPNTHSSFPWIEEDEGYLNHLKPTEPCSAKEKDLLKTTQLTDGTKCQRRHNRNPAVAHTAQLL